ncbi:MAG TPA: polysaccharide deacetylase family protein, partial [Edaphobacter sp.]|nr:polysaccharide deacetylase family protein [Edaphobacter sp.]
MAKQIFYDPQRKRWKRLRILLDSLALAGLLIGTVFLIGLITMKPLPELLLYSHKRNYRTLASQQSLKSPKFHRSAHRKTDAKPGDVPLNSGEGLRAAYYVEDDPASFSSLRQHISQIDLLFPEWVHVVSPDGALTGFSVDNRPYKIVDRNTVRPVDRNGKVGDVITNSHVNVDVFPLVNNYDPNKGVFMPEIGQFLNNETARANFIHQADVFLAANPTYRGLSIDLEEIPLEAQPGFKALIAALYADFHPRNLRVFVNVPAHDDDFDMKFLADHSDGLLLMNYDEHETGSGPGPIASQDWFVDNLKWALTMVPKEKLICAIGSYGYDWTTTLPSAHRKGQKAAPEKVLSAVSISTQQAWQQAYDSGSKIDLDDDSLNVHFAYDDDDAHVRHYIWFFDAVTALNEMRAARELGIQTYAMWRLGQEDNSLWKVWDNPLRADPAKDLAQVPPGYDVDTEGEGDVLRVTRKPQDGSRDLTVDDDKTVPPHYRMVLQESMESFPLSYTITQYGYQPKKVAISFDDGPDSEWTPKILDVLKKYNVKGVFLLIGEEAEKNVGIMQRVYREGHEIGNHSFTHPDIAEISKGQVDLELNLTERLFASKLGVQPLYFRPPYSIDQEPDTNDQAAPVERIQELGYVVLGNKIDTNDWDENPRKTPKEITDGVFEQIADMDKKPWTRGSIILMHDGGGDRSATVAALPMLITTLRERGYEIVPVSELIGKTRAEVMPPLTSHQQWQARADSIAFFLFGFFNNFVVGVFFVGDILMSARLIIIGIFALIDR